MTLSGQSQMTNDMKKTDWKTTAELIGIAAIVASLVFVGLQLKLSQDIAVAAQYHDRAALTVDYMNAQLESGDLAGWGAIGSVDPSSDESLENLGRWQLTGFGRLIMADNHYYQYQSGFLEDEAWEAQRRSLKNNLASPSSPIRRSYETFRDFFRDSFVELCDSLIAEA